MDSKSHVARFRRQNFSRLLTRKAKISEFQNPDYLTWSENSILKMIKGKVKSIPSVSDTVKPNNMTNMDIKQTELVF